MRSSSSRKKRKKMHQSLEWRSDAQHRIYSSKLLHALQRVRLCDGSSAARRVHEAANRVLAATARGRSRWSRAILTTRLTLKLVKKNNVAKQQRKLMTAITSRARRKSKGLPAVQRKAGVLSRLVPGCRKQPLPVVLEEATDYIVALEMQVRTMSALAELLCVFESSTDGFATALDGAL